MPIESGKHYKRTQFLVAKKFQLQYVGLILGLMFVTAFLCAYVAYYTSLVYLGEKLANVYPQGRLVAIIKTVNIRMLFSVLLVSPLVAVFALFLSHRIAGPMFRMEKTLSGIASGDLTPRTHLVLRKNDEFVPIANGINKATMAFKGTIAQEVQLVNKAQTDLEQLRRLIASRSDDHASVSQALGSLDLDLKSIAKEVSKYRLA